MSISTKAKDKYTTKQGKKQWDTVEACASKKRKNKQVLKCGSEHFTEGTSQRMGRCRNRVWVVADSTMQKKKFVAGESCKCPWCCMCAWFKSKKESLKIATCMKYIQQEHKKVFLFLTLTAPNVKGDKLGEEISRYNRNFKKLMDRTEVLNITRGYVRKLEVTYNGDEYITSEIWYGNKKKYIKARGYYFQSLGLKVGDRNPNYNTYHPHFHVMLAVDQSYFKNVRQYIKHDKWLELWREAMGDSSITQVDVRRITINSGKEIGEIAKYTAKDEDYTVSPDVFGVFYKALTGRQKTTYSGLFAEANKKYKDKNDKEMDKYKDKDLTEYVYVLFYRWEKDGYLLTDVRELTEQERAAIHGQTIEEMEVKDDD